VLDIEVPVELHQAFIDELSTIISDNGMWYAIYANNVSLDESLNLFGRDVCEWLDFDLF